MNDPVLLSRIQFAITICFHFIFPPISIGLAWMLVAIEWKAWRSRDSAWVDAGRFFAKLLALNFAVGVATGIVMEFQFGTNWSEYSKFVGDIFGAPLAAEALFAFFLESTFLGLYLFGRKRVGPGIIWFSILMVAVGSTISAFWIIVANSWQQTPAGYVLNEAVGRAELTDFWAAVFNPSTLPRFSHTVLAAIICGAFFMAGVSAIVLRSSPESPGARRSMGVAVVIGLLASVLVIFPIGHLHAQQVARTQPAKFAAIEGLYTTQARAPLLAFGLVKSRPPEIQAEIAAPIPGLLSWMAFGDFDAEVKGLDAFPEDERPPLWLTFVSFHNMVILGVYFVLLTLWGTFQLWRGKLWKARKLLLLMALSIPLPVLACQFGWIAAEVGRQPWIVQGMLRTDQAASPAVSVSELWFSIIMFSAIYALLFVLYLFLMTHEIRHERSLLGAGEAAS